MVQSQISVSNRPRKAIMTIGINDHFTKVKTRTVEVSISYFPISVDWAQTINDNMKHCLLITFDQQCLGEIDTKWLRRRIRLFSHRVK